jgi:hypothetical protein
MNQIQIHYLESLRVPIAPVHGSADRRSRPTARELAACMRRRGDPNP